MRARFALAVIVCAVAFGLPACAAGQGHVSATASVDSSVPRCNLKLDWDAVAQRYEAAYEEPTSFASAADLARTRYVADEACSAGQILDWQEAVGGSGSDVCQFAWRYNSMGMIDVFACVRVERIS